MAFAELHSLVAKLESDIAAGPIVPSVAPDEIRRHLAARYDFTRPLDLDEVGADVEAMLRTWQVHVTHPRYFGLFNPSVTLASVVADTLVALFNPQLATWRTSPAANEIERHTLAWLMGKFGFPPTALASFTSGGAEANLSAVVVALTRAFPEYGEDGLRALAAAPTIYLSGEAHHSFSKIAHVTGLGRRAVRTVTTDRHLRMDLGDLARRVAEDRRAGCAPVMVVGTAGTTAAGAIDPLPELAQFCRSEGLWFHVDAAWGGAAIISPHLRGHLAGIEAADSITCDAHKWFSVPMGAGMFFCRHPDAVGRAFRVATSYMPGKTPGPTHDPYTTGYVEMIEHQTRMGDVLRRALQRAGWRIVNTSPLPLVCFTREGLDTTAFLAALYQRQIAWMSDVRLAGGEPVLRACVTSFRTSESDIEWVVREMTRLA